ncbi:apolipoprotein C-IV isoform X2 [Trichosurus vulpecula]|uniref:apolipoprotein C-IV isoform X2 n=1 Tax=Trichosurus vulpecula TaxID=9337 RepID=UPI00186B2036|nr:apolipoprotein C-IV isoform X2 [Trichosurus vulpecula]
MSPPHTPLLPLWGTQLLKDTKPLEMFFLRLTCTRGSPILLWVLVLAWATVAQREELPTTQPHKEDGEEGWKVSRFFWKTVEPLLTKASESWDWIRTPGPVRDYLQTYYEDHLSGLGLRAQDWLHTSKQKALSLCPKTLCGSD